MPVQAESQTSKTTPTAIVLPERRVEVLPANRNPFLVYIGSLASGSRRTMLHALDTIAAMVGPSFTGATFP
jgi:hypothetical protein